MSHQTAPLTEEERIARRQRVLLKGVVAWNGETVSTSCTVRDISETGAKVKLDAPVALPVHFVLHVEVGGWKVDCERVWMEGLQMGVRFIGERTRSKLHREQVVKSSEDAFSAQTKWEMEMRAKAESQVRHGFEAPKPHDLVNQVRNAFLKR